MLLLRTLLLLLQAPPALGQSASASLDSLLSVERSFARASSESGIRSAFLQFLDDSAIVFRPLPVPGRPAYQSQPASTGVLTWEPAIAGISDAGDLGFTAGPYQYRAHQGDSLPAYGHYVSVWRRDRTGAWRVLADIGVSHPDPSGIAGYAFPVHEGSPSASDPRTASRTSVADLEGILRDAGNGPEGICRFVSRQVRLFRNGRAPAVGREACRNLAREFAPRQWEPAGGGIARSGDLAWAYGTARGNAGGGSPEGWSYLRIWQRETDDAWRIIVDVLLPVR